MSKDRTADTDTADQQTVGLILSQMERVLDAQLDIIDGLDAKVAQLFTAATLANTLVGSASAVFLRLQAGPTPLPGWLVVAAFMTAILWYIATICILVQALRVRAYYLPVKSDPDHIEARYLSRPAPQAQIELLDAYVQATGTNWDVLNRKARWVQCGLIVLAFEVVYLLSAIAIATAAMLH